DLMICLGALRIYVALDDLYGQLVVVVEQLLARPQTTPFRIIDFATETGGFAMLVEAKAGDGIQVTLDGHEAVQRGPQTITPHRHDQRVQPAVFVRYTNRALPLTA